jgi:L-fucose isomerase-like protein
VVSSLEVSGVEQALRMVRAQKQFAATSLMVLAGTERKEAVLDCLGTKVKHVPRNVLPDLFDKTPKTEEAREIAKTMFKHAEKVVEPTREDGLNAARSYIAAKHLLKQEECNALTTDCLGMVTERKVPTPPCMAATIFQDAGVTYGCEADVMAALSLMLPSYLVEKPGFINDPVPETVKNHLITAHCVCGTKLNGFDKHPEPYRIRSHSESALGVSLQVLWKEEQPVTLVRFQSPTELILDTGTVVTNVNTPPAGGCRTNFEIAMNNIEDVRDVLGFHQVVFYGNHKRDVEAFCQLAGIKVIHSPEHAPEPKTS